MTTAKEEEKKKKKNQIVHSTVASTTCNIKHFFSTSLILSYLSASTPSATSNSSCNMFTNVNRFNIYIYIYIIFALPPLQRSLGMILSRAQRCHY